MLSISIKEQINKLPPAVRLFTKRASILLLVWILIYYPLLQPARIPDRWISNVTASGTAKLLSMWYAPATAMEQNKMAVVAIDDRSVIRIGDPCNAFDLFVLYIAFLLCLPTDKKRMLLFGIGGICAIFMLNLIRCNALVWIALNQREWLDVAHKYIFTAIVYCCIFYGWMLYTKNYHLSNEKQ